MSEKCCRNRLPIYSRWMQKNVVHQRKLSCLLPVLNNSARACTDQDLQMHGRKLGQKAEESLYGGIIYCRLASWCLRGSITMLPDQLYIPVNIYYLGRQLLTWTVGACTQRWICAFDLPTPSTCSNSIPGLLILHKHGLNTYKRMKLVCGFSSFYDNVDSSTCKKRQIWDWTTSEHQRGLFLSNIPSYK